MLGPFAILPLLKGWEYKLHYISKILNKGEAKELTIPEVGWVTIILAASDDSQMTFEMEWQGADLNISSTGEASADGFIDLGTTEVDSSGFMPKYFRPNPNSTFGYYIMCLFEPGFYGSPIPYVPTLRLKMRLPSISIHPDEPNYYADYSEP